MPTKTKTGKVQAREACVITVGARPVEWQKRIVRDRRTGKLAEIDMNPELPPLDPGSEGVSYAFSRHEQVDADHPAVLDAPGCFVAVDE
jgi:hypothetical protein